MSARRMSARSLANLKPWRPGESGNVNGRRPSPLTLRIRALVGEGGELIVGYLVRVVDGTEPADPKTRVRAAAELLRRGAFPQKAIASAAERSMSSAERK